jgi:hypothetical protein
MSKQWRGLHGGWLGREMPGGGCPWQCRSLPEQKREGGSGIQIRCSSIGQVTGGMGCKGWRGAVARERQRVKTPWWVYLGGDEMAAGKGLGELWRAGSGTARESYSGDQDHGDAWGGGEQEVGCGVDGRAVAKGEVLHRRQSGKQREQRVCKGRRRGRKVQGLV